MQVVEVVWNDAHVTTGETTLMDAKKLKPIRTHTIGYLMADTDEGITLATDTYPDMPNEGKVINFITHDMIVEWWDFK
jgi:hypothetical protein